MEEGTSEEIVVGKIGKERRKRKVAGERRGREWRKEKKGWEEGRKEMVRLVGRRRTSGMGRGWGGNVFLVNTLN